MQVKSHQVKNSAKLNPVDRLNSTTDLCNNCAFDDKSMKLGTVVHHMVLQIFRYRAI